MLYVVRNGTFQNGGGGVNTKKKLFKQKCPKKFLQAETEEKNVAEGDLTFKIKCQGNILKAIPFSVLKILFFPCEYVPK